MKFFVQKVNIREIKKSKKILIEMCPFVYRLSNNSNDKKKRNDKLLK